MMSKTALMSLVLATGLGLGLGASIASEYEAEREYQRPCLQQGQGGPGMMRDRPAWAGQPGAGPKRKGMMQQNKHPRQQHLQRIETLEQRIAELEAKLK